MGREGAAAFEGTWNEVVVDGPVGRGTMHLADLWAAARGMFSLPRPPARAKLVSMTQAAEQLRAEYA
jgi:hypothetical protein